MAKHNDNGNRAEQSAVEHLESTGYKVVDRNWRTKWCEIDIVAKKNDVIYFVEVKYRQNSNYGDGLDYITDKKIRQMSFAAEIWVSNSKWGGSYELMAVAIAGDDFIVKDVIAI